MKIIYDYARDSSDFVRCDNCEAMMLVPRGDDVCPRCKKQGCLSDLEEPDDWQELSPVRFKKCY